MTTEMDLFRLDERQRLAWLMANRGTLLAVGTTWIGMILWSLAHDRMPAFLIAMVPLFALLRGGLFFYYCSMPVEVSGQAGALRLGRLFKTGAALLLALAIFLPLNFFGGTAAEPDKRYGFAWDVVDGDVPTAIVLACAFVWPWLTLTLSRASARRWISVATQLCEPLFVAGSVLTLLWLPTFEWEYRVLWIFLIGAESAKPAIGIHVAVAANGIYFIAWLWEVLRPRSTHASTPASSR